MFSVYVNSNNFSDKISVKNSLVCSPPIFLFYYGAQILLFLWESGDAARSLAELSHAISNLKPFFSTFPEKSDIENLKI